ncbi:MAG: DUF1428 domain-containing protein [Gemmatimonadaceae bacterium]
MARQRGRYVDGFVIVIPRRSLAAYKRVAARAGKVWRKYGALDYKECVADDLNPSMGGGMPMLGFAKMTKLKPRETVVFSYIVYKSRAHRDRVNARVMKDPAMSSADQSMPFDMKRFAWAGFKVIVDA